MRYILKDVPAVHRMDLAGGDILQICNKPDYGLKQDAEHDTGEEHINLSYDGDYPIVCLPLSAVERYNGPG